MMLGDGGDENQLLHDPLIPGGPGLPKHPPQGEAQRAEASRLLTTMAIVRANADADRDYISNFEPFATACLKAWDSGQEVRPESLSKAICTEWGVPSLPTAVGKVLLRRAEQREELVEVDGLLYPDMERLRDMPELGSQRYSMLARMNALADSVVEYASEVHNLSWSRKDATAALERLTDEFGAELAMAKQHGTLDQANLGENEALAVVYGFARRAIESDPPNFEYLEEMVQGTMLVNAVYFPDVGHVSKRLKDLRAYLDTTPVLRALGLADDSVQVATTELLTLLKHDFQVPMFVFSHTLDEIDGVLAGVAAALRRGTRGAPSQAGVAGRNREAIDALVRRGETAGEIEALRAELQSRLAALGIRVTDTPPHPERGHIDESSFDEKLDEVVAYKSRGAREKDLKSLAAVDRLRGSRKPRDLAQANALFVTANPKLVRASREFFGEAGRGSPVPHAMHETALTAQLWVRAPHPPPDLPRQLLIADCYAALNPGPELWQRWVQHIVRLKESGKVTEEQVQNLIYHQQAKSKLFEVTHGDPDAVGDETVADVLDRFESELQKPVLQEVEAERRRREQAEVERDQVRGELSDLKNWRTSEEQSTQRRHELFSRVRTISGFAIVILIVLALIFCGVVLQIIHGRLAWSVSLSLAVFGSTAGWAWAKRMSWKFPFAALAFAGAISALFVNIFSVLPAD